MRTNDSSSPAGRPCLHLNTRHIAYAGLLALTVMHASATPALKPLMR